MYFFMNKSDRKAVFSNLYYSTFSLFCKEVLMK